MADAANATERLIERIDRVLAENEGLPMNSYAMHDGARLRYIRAQINPRGMERRGEDNQSINHLHEVANMILRAYEKEGKTS